MIEAAAVLCLALNVYHEARGEPYEGQVAVAQVTVRRAGFDEDWICPAVYERGQFAWTRRLTLAGSRPSDELAWQRAQSIARQVILWGYIRHIPDYSRGATHYHAARVEPDWARRMVEVARIGAHRFFRRRG